MLVELFREPLGRAQIRHLRAHVVREQHVIGAEISVDDDRLAPVQVAESLSNVDQYSTADSVWRVRLVTGLRGVAIG